MADSSVHDLNKMKVADLRKELKIRGLNTVGNKTELIDRLTAALESDTGKIDTLSTEELMDDVLNDDAYFGEEIEDADVEDAEKVLDIDSSISADESKPLKLNKRKSSELSEDNNFSKVPPKKIVLNRVLSVNTSQNKLESTLETKSPENEDSTENVKQNEKVVIDSTEEKRVIKLSNLSAKERLEMRAKKFGTPLTVDQKKEARSARFGSAPTVNTSDPVKITFSNTETKLDTLKKRAERFGTNVSSVMSKLDLQERLERRKARFGAVDTPAKKITTVK